MARVFVVAAALAAVRGVQAESNVDDVAALIQRSPVEVSRVNPAKGKEGTLSPEAEAHHVAGVKKADPGFVDMAQMFKRVVNSISDQDITELFRESDHASPKMKTEDPQALPKLGRQVQLEATKSNRPEPRDTVTSTEYRGGAASRPTEYHPPVEVLAASGKPTDVDKRLKPGRTIETMGTDIFPSKAERSPPNGDEGFGFFDSAKWQEWFILGSVCAVLCILDLVVIQRLPDSSFWHCCVLIFWVVVAALYNIGIWCRMGHLVAFDWCSGYVLEWMLSMDNLFVFHLIFKSYRTPANQIHKAVFVGIVGAVAMRMVFFMVLSTLLHLFRWVRFVFGAFLIWSGIEAARADDDDECEVKDTWLMRGLKFLLGDRLLEDYGPNGEVFLMGDDGRWKCTVLLIVIFCLEFTDILFAVDSVSAKVAQVPNQYIAFSSSVLAMYGLRAMFFIVHDLVEMFDMLKYGLCAILIFIGVELMLAHWLKLESSTVCVVILSVFAFCIITSALKQRVIDRMLQRQLSKDDCSSPKFISNDSDNSPAPLMHETSNENITGETPRPHVA